MKRIFSTLMVSAMALTSIPLMSAPVTGNYTTTALAETSDLNSLASFYGADTAYFNFTNYAKNYLDTDMVITDCEDQSYGISMLQILTHNGVFAVSDIQQGAEKLADVQFNSEIESLIESYQLTRFNVPQMKLKRAFVKNDTETLVQTAMSSMTAQKYFHISLSMSETLPDGTNYSKATHDVAGIGITDGSWTFNGVSYDKCILTVDSNTTSFDENYCIYVNTSDNTFCIPAYDNVTLTAVIADDTVLNYQGKLGEQVQPPINNDTENPVEINIYTWAYKKTGEKYDEESGGYYPTYVKAEEDYEFTAGDLTYDSFYLAMHPTLNVPVADSYKVEFKDRQFDTYEIAFSSDSKDGSSFVKAENFAESAEISVHKASMKTSDNDDIVAHLVPTEPLYKSFFNAFKATAHETRNFSITDREDGILLQSDSDYMADVMFSHYDGGNLVANSELGFRIEPSAGNLLLRYDDELQKIRGFVDKDNDNIYETEIQSGDTNCDGIFDASDASKILEIYASLSTYKNPFPAKYINIFADCNGDGNINAVDAAEVLSKYAESSTS